MAASKRKRFEVYRNESDDEGTAYSRTLSLSNDRRRLLVAPSSPRKIAERTSQHDPVGWETALDSGSGFDWEAYANADYDHDEHGTEVILVKPAAKRYPTSDAPLREWAGYEGRSGYREEFLLEDLMLEGRSGAGLNLCSCGSLDPRERLYRCDDCFGIEMLCQECCVVAHKRLPLHAIKRWNGLCFESISLKQMGLTVQLGHHDMFCICPVRGHVDFIVIHINGIHEVNVDFCDCDQRTSHRQQLLRCEWFPSTVHIPQTACTRRALEHFLVQTLSGKLAAYEYYLSLERLTDNTGLNVPKSRYAAVMRMVREYRDIKMLKRAGRGNIVAGLINMKPGDLAIACPACPHPGINLPVGWENVEPGLKFLYFLILAMDANFRLKNRMRSSDAADPGLHTGFAYFVPEKKYKEHVLKHATQKDISTCSGFKTLAHAESKFSTGLRATGVGLCLCARHEFVRANGVGDLQKGERYCNMDYVFFSALAPLLLLSVVISYDIACQWKVNLWERMDGLPLELQVSLTFSAVSFSFGIPKFHAPAHAASCGIPHSLNLMPGVGRTDGEGIERNWAEMNRVANSTKEMGPGSRHDTLDDHFGHHNWRKYVTLGTTLRNKLLVAVAERDRQQGALDEFNSAIDPKYQQEWTAMIEAWDQDKSQPNPYTGKKINITEAEVRANLAEEEKIAVAGGRVHPHETTPSAFVALALTLEDSQRRLLSDVKIMSSLTPNQQSELHQRRMAVYRQIRRFRAVQNVYMQGMDLWLEQHVVEPEPEPENITIWLPSELDPRTRANMCTPSLVDIEIKLREAQCFDALDKARNHLRTKFHYIKHRNFDVRGQRPNTRAHALIDRMGDRVNASAAKYERARHALIALKGHGTWENTLRPLLKTDLSPPNGEDINIEDPNDEIAANGRKKSKKQLEELRKDLGQGRKVVSWIWRTVGVLGDGSDEELNEALRVEWAKARARAIRWREETMLLKEEMRRVRVYLLWRANWWEEHRDIGAADPTLAEGVAAYAHRQAAIQRALHTRFTELWENITDPRGGDTTAAHVDLDGDGLRSEAAIEENGEEDEGADDDDDDGV
ncbi:hypothetical protein BJ138DRAFT_1115126 [Hygrophoropsis aurantiaca]|uniref:Uncharacterized protein n=1 Tax=Hygrophoropsis aurantiaca TaxID=72124 RepID=A0ACB8A886_9AGAM|nr:hypothetical protein BJ138DRAFT_1115126 [Hygrophoropsis aurantiaca]